MYQINGRSIEESKFILERVESIDDVEFAKIRKELGWDCDSGPHISFKIYFQRKKIISDTFVAFPNLLSQYFFPIYYLYIFAQSRPPIHPTTEQVIGQKVPGFLPTDMCERLTQKFHSSPHKKGSALSR